MSIIEEWKVIEKATNYEISTCGQVKNTTTNRILKPTLNGGSWAIGLRINNKTTTAFGALASHPRSLRTRS